MLFHNDSGKHLRFKLGELVYDVPPGSECDVPPNLSPLVAKRGLKLKLGSVGGARVEASVALPPEPKRRPAGVVSSAPALVGDAEEEAPQVDDAIDKLIAAGALPPKKRRDKGK